MSGLFGVHIPELQLTEGDVREALSAARLLPGESYLELGCGEGRGLVIAALEFDAVASGVDYLQDALDTSRRRAQSAGVDVTLIHGDLMTVSPTDADVILMHLGPAFHDVLAPRLEKLLTPTTRVAACGWPVPGWIEQWDSWGFPGGYIYRPGDPRQHGEWHSPSIPVHATPEHPAPHLQRVLAPHSYSVDCVRFLAGADLRDIELRLTGAADNWLSVYATERTLGRGQEMLVEVHCDAAAVAGELPAQAQLELWARSSNGRFTLRGAPLTITGIASPER